MKKFAVVVVCLFVPAFAAGHSVTFDWTQSNSPDIVANKMYCGTTPGGPYPYSHKTKNPTTTLELPKTPPGTYYCVVTAINDQDEESGPSNEVQVVVP